MLPTEAPSRPGYALTTLRVPSVLPNRICSYYKKRFCLATFTLDRTAEAIALHIHYYNTERIHTALGMSPAFAKKLKRQSESACRWLHLPCRPLTPGVSRPDVRANLSEAC